MNTVRIDALREKALHYHFSYDRFHLDFYKKLSQNGTFSLAHYSEAFEYAFGRLEPMISDGELIVGKPETYDAAVSEEWNALLPEVTASDLLAFDGQDSHMVVDYELLLEAGIEGILARIDRKLEMEQDKEKITFYHQCKVCLNAVTDLSFRYAEKAEELLRSEQNEKRKEELLKIAQICRKVPLRPAESFYEAVQSVNFLTFCLSCDPCRLCPQQFMLGRLDRYLYRFYRHDIDAGILTYEDAQELIDCFCVQMNNRVPNGLSCGYMLGGRDEDGHTVANDLTRIGLQAIDNVRLVFPAVGLCYTPDMPEELLDLACEILSHSRSHPALYNDEIITQGLEYYGVPHSEAVRYTHSTCVEITPETSSNVWVASPYTNMVQLLLDTMKTLPDSFEALIAAYFERLDRHIKSNFDEQNAFRIQRASKSVMPLLSCFVHDCIERGLDINAGGARYNWIMPSFVGMANLVDSLYVLKKMVYEEQSITMESFNQLLDSNFEQAEALRMKCLNKYAKYGNDVEEVDQLFRLIAEHITAQCETYRTHFDSRLIPSVFCWMMHDIFGQETGASPDGRKAGFPLGDGSGPCQGRELKGPTASILSSTKWSHREFIGGVAVNMKFSKKTFCDESCAAMKTLIRTYMQRGGFELQINVLDRETLLTAQKDPDRYRDLVVRIGGYSDYFVKLTPSMQAEVLLRTEHGL